ncbi:MAG: hypothetical protein J5979_01340 [Lachnospiraceae bacterium]|nr:hypothetical protein [Lachnospiraceae bacterium]
MKVEIKNESEVYEIELLQITQLCGLDFKKKDFILNSLYKYFSGSKYADHESCYQDNILVDGEKVGRKYFSVFRLKRREDLIDMIKLTKSSLMMKYLLEQLPDFECQKEMDAIAEHLDKLYLRMNQELSEKIHHIELCYEQKKFLEIIQTSIIAGEGEEPLEKLSNYELLDTYLDLLMQMQTRRPEKYMIILENLDHMLSYQEYSKTFDRLNKVCGKSDTWFVISTSLEGFVMLDSEFFSGITIINEMIYTLPEKEKIISFLQNNYPCEKELSPSQIMDAFRVSIHDIGKSGYDLNIQSKVMLKLINDSLCVSSSEKININQLEKCFLMDKNVV